jgi:UDP-3-O-[3-hydroxymyristoyl] glucosamine N-acyltransferase
MKDTSLVLEELALAIGAIIEGDGSLIMTGANDLSSATPNEVSFLANERYIHLLKETRAGAVLIHPEQQRPQGKTYLLHENPSLAFQKILDLLYDKKSPITYFQGVHKTAVIHDTASIAKTASIGPYAVIDGHTVVHDGVSVGAHSYIGPHCVLQENVLIHPHVVLREGTIVGSRSIIQPGAVLGSCGFGYVTDKQGKHQKLEQQGSVTLSDDVEIGANTTIDRARFKTTYIGQGTKIDNLVQIAHNVRIGKDCFIVAQVGIAGSTTIGNHVVLAGKVGINGHIEIGDGVMVAGSSSVSKSLKTPGKYSGIPAMPLGDYNRMAALMRHIEDLFHRLRTLEQKNSS